MQLFIKYLLEFFLGYNNGYDWYRSCNCFMLMTRGIYVTIYGNADNMLYNTCNMYISYTAVDLLIIYQKKINRIELIFHHFITLFAYLHFRYFNNDAYLAHLFLLAESLSIFNALLRKNHSNLLKKWRLFCLLCIRLPLWLLLFNTIYVKDFTNILTTSKILFTLVSVTMPIIDVYLFKKIVNL